MNKIKVTGTVVELDGDEMTRIIWDLIKKKLIIPYLDVNLEYYDLGVEYRDKTNDQVTIDAAHAIKKHGVGVKCATITPDEARVKEFGLKEMWKSPNGTIRNILGGVIFREPIICQNVPRLVPGWTQPIVVGRHAFGDQYRATDFRFPGKGTLTIKFVGEDGQVIEKEVFKSPGSGVAMAMYNLDESIREFARASMMYGLMRKWPVYLSTKNTILKAYDGRFKDLFEEVYENEFKAKFAAVGASPMSIASSTIWWHRPSNGRVAMSGPARTMTATCSPTPWRRGTAALGLMTSVLTHARTARRWRRKPPTAPSPATTASTRRARRPATNPIASILCVDAGPRSTIVSRWTTPPTLVDSSPTTLEKVCVDTVEQGFMTKDLALLVGADQKWLSTAGFLDKIDENLKKAMGA